MAQIPVLGMGTRGRHVLKPHAKAVKSDSLLLAWETQEDLRNEDSFIINYKISSQGQWSKYMREKPCRSNCLRIENLKPHTGYQFKVKIVSEYWEYDGPFSPVSDVINTAESDVVDLQRKSTLCSKLGNELNQYQLPLKEDISARNEKYMTRKMYVGKRTTNFVDKTLLLVGATGSGKTTLVNAMANYLSGVKWEDSCRFRLIPPEMIGETQAVSQTTWVTSYTIYPTKGSPFKSTVQLIDTPGFGHTSGIEHDKKIVQQIEELFTHKDEKGIVLIDAVCFIVKAPDARLTESQIYIFNSILALFGNDIKENICTIITFADGERPPVLDALAAMEPKIVPEEPFFPVNNSALFADNTNSFHTQISQMFWKIGFESLGNFFKHIEGLHTKSISLSAEVLASRNEIDQIITSLQPRLERGFLKLDCLEQEISICKEQKTKCLEAKREMDDFCYQVEQSEIFKRETNFYNYNCNSCKYTCNGSCVENETFGDTCTKCLCPSDLHVIASWEFHVEMCAVSKTYKERQLEYRQSIREIEGQLDIIEALYGDMTLTRHALGEGLEMLTFQINRLNKMALLKKTISKVDYINLMITKEEVMQSTGFQRRIATLEEYKKKDEFKNAPDAKVDTFEAEMKRVFSKFKQLFF